MAVVARREKPALNPSVGGEGGRGQSGEYAQESAVTELHEELSRQLERARVVAGRRRLSRDGSYSHRTAQQRTRVWAAADSLQGSSRSLYAVRASTPSQVRWQ